MKKNLRNTVLARILKSEKDPARHTSDASQPGKSFVLFVLNFFALTLAIGISRLFFIIQHLHLPITQRLKTLKTSFPKIDTKYIFALAMLLTFTSVCSAQTTYDWTGAVDNDWSNAANWESTTGGVTTNPASTYPGSADQAQIGVLPMTNTSNWPVISAGGATSVGSIVWGTENYLNVYLTVNTTFTVNGSINNTSAVPGNGASSAYTFNISGTGTMNVTGNLNIGYDLGFSTSTPGNNNSFAFNSTLNQLSIQGSTYLNSVQGGTHHRGFNPALNIISGTLTTTSIQSTLSNSTTYNSTLSSSVSVGNSSGTPTATLKLTGASSLPSFSPYIVNIITFNNPGATVEYSGASQTVYTDNAVANLNNTISYYNIKFSGTGLKTALSGNLNVAGDFTNAMANDACNCNGVSLSAPTVNFNGTTQNLYGGGGNGTTFYTVNCSNSGTKTMQNGTFKLASTGILTMSGSSTALAAGTGIFTLLSDANGSATVAAIPSGCSVTGVVNVQRFIKGSSSGLAKRGYRLMSSSVYTGTDANSSNVFDFQYLLGSIYVSGLSNATNGFNVPLTQNPSLYLFREDDPPPPTNTTIFTTTYNWKGVAKINNSPVYNIGTQFRNSHTNTNDTTTTVPVGNGFLMLFRGDNSHTANYTYPYGASVQDVTLTASGTLNTKTINVRLWFANSGNNLGNNLSYTSSTTIAATGSGSALTGGFNLVGNPYPSTINWEKYNNSAASGALIGTVSNIIYEFDELNHQYVSYIASQNADVTSERPTGLYTGSGTNMIASGQGFFVQATAKSKTLTFTENAKVNLPLPANLTNMMSFPQAVATATNAAAPPALVRLRMVLDSNNSDEVLIALKRNTSSKFISDEDALDLGGNGALESLSVLSSDSVKLAINQTPFPGATREIIPLSVDATASQTFQLTVPELRNVPKLYAVWLKDSFTGDSVNLKLTTSYSFTIDKTNPATFGSKRFSVIISQDPAYAYHLLSFTAERLGNSSNVETHWTTANDENYTNFTVERSTDGGKTFTIVGGMWGTGAADYALMDKNVPTGTNLYRLKSEDTNNTITYSALATVVITDNGNKISVYPNPAVSIVSVSLISETNNATGYNFAITNNYGQIVKQGASVQANWQTNVSDLPPGTYVIQVVNSKDKSLIDKSKLVKL